MSKVKVRKEKSPRLKKTIKTVEEFFEGKDEEYEKFSQLSKEEKKLVLRESEVAAISQLITDNELSHDIICEMLCPQNQRTYAKFFANNLIGGTYTGWHEALVKDFAILFRCSPNDFSFTDYHKKAKLVPNRFKDDLTLLYFYWLYNKLYLKLYGLWFDIDGVKCDVDWDKIFEDGDS